MKYITPATFTKKYFDNILLSVLLMSGVCVLILLLPAIAPFHLISFHPMFKKQPKMIDLMLTIDQFGLGGPIVAPLTIEDF